MSVSIFHDVEQSPAPDEASCMAQTTADLRAANQRWREIIAVFYKEVAEKASLTTDA